MKNDPKPSLIKFMAAVRAHRSGNFAHVDVWARVIESKHGKDVARRCKEELIAYAKSEHPADLR